MKRTTNDQRLRALGFDKGARGCSQCEALSVNGTPTHEAGCPNARAAARWGYRDADLDVDTDEDEDQDEEDTDEDEDEGRDEDEDEDQGRDTGRYVGGYRIFRNGTEREDFGGDR